MDEFVIEWIKGENTASVTFPSNSSFATRIRKLAEKTSEVTVIEDKNGYLFAHIPTSYIKFNAPRQLSEEQKQVLAERMRGINR